MNIVKSLPQRTLTYAKNNPIVVKFNVSLSIFTTSTINTPFNIDFCRIYVLYLTIEKKHEKEFIFNIFRMCVYDKQFICSSCF